MRAGTRQRGPGVGNRTRAPGRRTNDRGRRGAARTPPPARKQGGIRGTMTPSRGASSKPANLLDKPFRSGCHHRRLFAGHQPLGCLCRPRGARDRARLGHVALDQARSSGSSTRTEVPAVVDRAERRPPARRMRSRWPASSDVQPGSGPPGASVRSCSMTTRTSVG